MSVDEDVDDAAAATATAGAEDEDKAEQRADAAEVAGRGGAVEEEES